MARLGTVSEVTCPYIDENDPRCADHFRLRRLNQAFHVCANGGHHQCPTYQQRLREQNRREPTRLTINITVEGQHPPRPRPRPTSRPDGEALEPGPARRFRFNPLRIALRATGS